MANASVEAYLCSVGSICIPRIMFARQVMLTNKSRQGTLSGVWSAQPGCLPTGRRTGQPKIKLSMKTDLCSVGLGEKSKIKIKTCSLGF